MADYSEHLNHGVARFEPWSGHYALPLPVAAAHHIDEQTWARLGGAAPADADMHRGQPVKLSSGELVPAEAGDTAIVGIFQAYTKPNEALVWYRKGYRFRAPMDDSTSLVAGDECDFVVSSTRGRFYLDADTVGNGAFRLIGPVESTAANQAGRLWHCELAHPQLTDAID